ncbi:Conserved_hypothetical protein [Hexamita inflata]|uniref:EGF-like domain-containing protein n=1 Tax=Hexamita inflata TaxID=28002 RepID=A0ABP1GZB5_9EUKA
MQNQVDNEKIQLVEKRLDNIQRTIIELDQYIQNNKTEIYRNINVQINDMKSTVTSIYEKSENNLQFNTTILDHRIQDNITMMLNEVQQYALTSDLNIFSNITMLDLRIFQNISQINDTISNVNTSIFALYDLIETINNSLKTSNAIVLQQQLAIENLTKHIDCINDLGYKMSNGICSQISCNISGQQIINGVCQCSIINQIVQNGACVCPYNQVIVGNICGCNVTGQIIYEGKCICSTAGAFIRNGTCTCGLYGLNISNICACPTGASIVNGICICINQNAFISGNQCICPVFASLVDNICVCPNNSAIVDNICSCNIIAGQIMNNGVCKCQTSGAVEINGICSCVENQLNISNTCGCPENSILINNVCTCQIEGQYIANYTCQCLNGYVVINNSCKSANYTINSTDSLYTCSQYTYITTFDLQNIMYIVTSSNNFSEGYVFNTGSHVQEAFIDIKDNVYSSIVPLFSSQSSFNNIKIQIGIQNTAGGSLISNNNNIIINYLNIISKTECYVSISNGQLNILQESSKNANIQNLMLNLSFAMSNGNITLISNVFGSHKILNYQILGNYQSYKCLSMISLSASNATLELYNINFMPSTFNVGNYSSYLLSVVLQSSVLLTNISIIQGNSSKYLDMVSQSSQNAYFFGGLITSTVGTTVKINQMISSCYQNYKTLQIRFSGLLIGYAQLSSNNITIQNTCLLYVLTSIAQFTAFGLIGTNEGNITFTQSQMQISELLSYYHTCGIIGQQAQTALYSEISKINITFNVQSVDNQGNNVGILFGLNFATHKIINNVYAKQSKLAASSYVGGLIGQLTYNSTLIQNVTVQTTNISTSITGVGGLIGFSFNTVITIDNTIIDSTRISGPSYGAILGINSGGVIFKIKNSRQIGDNYFNDVIRTNCANFTNTWSVTQCT